MLSLLKKSIDSPKHILSFLPKTSNAPTEIFKTLQQSRSIIELKLRSAFTTVSYKCPIIHRNLQVFSPQITYLSKQTMSIILLEPRHSPTNTFLSSYQNLRIARPTFS